MKLIYCFPFKLIYSTQEHHFKLHVIITKNVYKIINYKTLPENVIVYQEQIQMCVKCVLAGYKENGREIKMYQVNFIRQGLFIL